MKLRISQTAATIPLFGYAILWNDKIQEYSTLLGGDISIGSATRLRCLYFGSLTLTAAWGLYLWKCPKIIRKYSYTDDYVSARIAIFDAFEFQLAKRHLESYLQQTQFPITVNSEPEMAYLMTAIGNSNFTGTEYRPFFFRAYYLCFEGAGQGALAVCSALCFAGMILVLAPSFDVLVRVISKMLR